MRERVGSFMEVEMSPATYAAPRREEIAKIERLYSKPPEPISVGGIVLSIFIGLFIGSLIGLPVGFVYAIIFYGDTAYGRCILICAILGVIIILGFYIYDKVDSEKRRQRRLRDKEELENEVIQYTVLFEEKARERSTRFSQNPVTLRFAEQIFNSFKQYINYLPSGAHIEKIHAKYKYTVCSDHISYQQYEHGERKIDFRLERLRDLKSPLDQAALSQVIAMNLHSMISSTDISGTFYQINIDYIYTPEGVTTILTYTADNRYYRPVRDWV